MGKLTITFPILITHPPKSRVIKPDQSGEREEQSPRRYSCQPLFYPMTSTEHAELKVALRSLKRALSKQLRLSQKKPKRSLSLLMWLQFNPPLEVQMLSVDFRSGGQHIYGDVLTVHFEVRGVHFIIFPSLDHHVIVPELSERGRLVDLEDQVTRALQNLLRAHRDEADVSDWTQRITQPLTVNMQLMTISAQTPQIDSPFEVPPSIHPFQQLLSHQRKFAGKEEIYKVAKDLNDEDYTHLRSYGRAREVKELYEQIYRKTNQPIALIGPQRVGKTNTLLSVLKRHLNEHPHQVAHAHLVEKIWHLDPLRVISGMSMIGAWQNRFEAILTYIKTRVAKEAKEGQIKVPPYVHDILFIDQPLSLLQVGKSEGSEMTLSSILKPYLERGDFQLVLEMTPETWAKFKQLDQSFADLCSVSLLKPMSFDEMRPVFAECRVDLEERYQTLFSPMALSRILNVHQAFLKKHALPGGVLDFAQSLAYLNRSREISERMVIDYFADRFSISAELFDPSREIDDQALSSVIYSQLIGQPDAAEILIKVVHLIKSGLKSPEKPIATLLFAGPTGVGKTEAAKVITRYLFKNEAQMIRFDMNEYIDSESATRLIGDLNTPEGLLTSRVRHNPFCVLLLDEIEKAHPSIHDLLLQVLGEGRLSDALGRTVDFTNTIIIMTSNIGAREAKRGLGFDSNAETHIKARYRSAVESTFRPEMVNRIDHIITFSSLTLESAMEITRLLIQKLLKRDGFRRRTALVSITEHVARDIARRGFDPEMGGRALKRFIERELAMLSAQEMSRVKPEGVMIYELTLDAERIIPAVTPLEHQAPLDDPQGLSISEHERESTLKQLCDTLQRYLDVADEMIYEPSTRQPAVTRGRLGDQAPLSVGLNLSHLLETPEANRADLSMPAQSTEQQSAHHSDSISTSHSNEEDRLDNAEPQRLLMLYMIKDQCGELLNEFRELVLSLSERTHKAMITQLPQLSIDTNYRGWTDRVDYREKLNILTLREFIHEFMEISQLESTQSLTVQRLAQLVFLNIQLNSIAQTSSRGCVILLRSMINKRGWAQLNQLADYYLYALHPLKVAGEIWVSDHVDTPSIAIVFRTPGVYEWIKADHGVHLFYPTFGLPVPIRADVISLNVAPETSLQTAHITHVLSDALDTPPLPKPPRPQEVVRLYTDDRPFGNTQDVAPGAPRVQRSPEERHTQDEVMHTSRRGVVERWTLRNSELDQVTLRLKERRELMTDLKSNIAAYSQHADQWLIMHHMGLDTKFQLHTLIQSSQADPPPHDGDIESQRQDQRADDRLLTLAEDYES